MTWFRRLTFLSIFLFAVSVAFAATNAPSERDLVKAAMALRPADPWPRGIGHVVYAWPGSNEQDKGYEEPGGSLSPAVSSFGISLWVLDSRGKLLCTSDSIPLDKVSQRFAWEPGHALPGIVTETSYYTATWSLTQPGTYVLYLRPKAGTQLVIAIRSVGSAGGPIHSIQASNRRLAIDGKWNLRYSPAIRLRAIGHEGDSEWTTLRNIRTEWHGSDGWGFALLTATPEVGQTIFIGPAVATKPSSLHFSSGAPTLHIELPDSRFQASLDAQTVHLLMGLVGNQTRPGDPTNYPLPWLRDGAYVVVGLARAGQIGVAKQLAHYFADHDFFGGFGPEADAPGLSLWAIGEVSVLAGDPAFDASMWPSVQRKVQWIERMRNATTPIYQQPFGPIVPMHAGRADLNLVAEPARNGLIIGRMDWGRPLLFVNAVSYLGLVQAADLAARTGHPQETKQWRDEASSLQTAWERALPSREHENERTYISALWPTWVGGNSIGTFSPLLEQRWERVHDPSGAYRTRPLWTYFDIGDAHQWLMLHRQDRAWQTLSWFFDHQAATGLYTWWEGSGEENGFGRWEQVRGWTDPKYVTPHYWTAAEMLLLQLDMLACVDRTRASTIVIGEGVPASWLQRDIQVRGLRTELGVVDWSWRGGKLAAIVHGDHSKVVAGSAFGPAVQVAVTYLKH
jgi:hypothetical protein